MTEKEIKEKILKHFNDKNFKIVNVIKRNSSLRVFNCSYSIFTHCNISFSYDISIQINIFKNGLIDISFPDTALRLSNAYKKINSDLIKIIKKSNAFLMENVCK